MSRLLDYSKFDHLESDSSDDNDDKNDNKTEKIKKQTQQRPPQQQEEESSTLVFRRSSAHTNRFRLEYQGHLVYEWEQSLNDVTLYIPTPASSGIRSATDVVCHIQPQHLQVGHCVSNDGNAVVHLFMNEATAGTVDVANSTWTWEKDGNSKTGNNGLLTIELLKAQKGVVWQAACVGPPPRNVRLDPLQLEQERQRLLLERWQEENPGMDFRGATFNGAAPDPRSFMGGVTYQ